jgi:hypothetical protein
VQIATSSENLELNMEQVEIHEGAPLAGRSLVDASLRQRFGVVVVGIQRADGGWSSTRAPTRRCAPGIISSCSATSTNCASSRTLPVNPARPFGEPMAARILDGPSVAAALNAAVMPDVQRFTAAAGRPPGLGIVLVGDDPASEIYVRGKIRRVENPGSGSSWSGFRDRHARRAPRHRRSAESQP